MPADLHRARTRMTPTRRTTAAPRKIPRQARSHFTVDIIHEATIQVLLAEGSQRLTTTRVAERAGVSVGTLYQYYQDRVSLLYAAQRRHLAHVAEKIGAACRKHHGDSLSSMVRGVVLAFAGAKLERADESRAIYLITPELTAAGLVAPETVVARNAISTLIASANDARFNDLPAASSMFMSAMRGSLRSALERSASPETLRYVGEQTITLCDSYLHALAVKH
jgi:AcrR family transcriptional regulator